MEFANNASCIWLPSNQKQPKATKSNLLLHIHEVNEQAFLVGSLAEVFFVVKSCIQPRPQVINVPKPFPLVDLEQGSGGRILVVKADVVLEVIQLFPIPLAVAAEELDVAERYLPYVTPVHEFIFVVEKGTTRYMPC